MSIVIFGERCPGCSKYYSPRDLTRSGDGGCIVRCLKCQEKHNNALDVLAGGCPTTCGECGISFADLCATMPGDHVSMFVHDKDGLYQLLCPMCDAKYVPQRKDLYGATPFWHERGL